MSHQAPVPILPSTSWGQVSKQGKSGVPHLRSTGEIPEICCHKWGTQELYLLKEMCLGDPGGVCINEPPTRLFLLTSMCPKGHLCRWENQEPEKLGSAWEFLRELRISALNPPEQLPWVAGEYGELLLPMFSCPKQTDIHHKKVAQSVITVVPAANLRHLWCDKGNEYLFCLCADIKKIMAAQRQGKVMPVSTLRKLGPFVCSLLLLIYV